MANNQLGIGGISEWIFGGPDINGPAPTIDTSGVNSELNQSQRGRIAQGQAMDLANQLALGGGPSAVNQAYQNQVANSTAAANALASSASGRDQGLARRQAMMAAAQGQQAAGQSAALGRAQEQLGGLQAMGSLAGAQRGQDIETANLLGGLASNQAQLQEQQNQANLQAAEFQEKQNNQELIQLAGLAAGALAFADAPMSGNASMSGKGPTGSEMHLKEPGGPSHWILREEPDFLLAMNARTGELRKILTAPLTPKERAQAMAPHGAGPLEQSRRAVQNGSLKYGDLSNLNEDPNADGGGLDIGSIMQMFGSGAMAAADLHLKSDRPHSIETHGTGPHVEVPHAVNIARAVRSKHAGLYYGDLDMGDPGDTSYDAQMSAIDFDKLGYPSSSEETTPRQTGNGMLFGKYSQPGTGVGGGDATDTNAATGADPYAASPGEDNPATNPSSNSNASFAKILQGALMGYADPQGTFKSITDKKNKSKARQTSGVQSPGVSSPSVSPIVMHDGTLDGPIQQDDPELERIKQFARELATSGLAGGSNYSKLMKIAGFPTTTKTLAAKSQKPRPTPRETESHRKELAQEYNFTDDDNRKREILKKLTGQDPWDPRNYSIGDTPLPELPKFLEYKEKPKDPEEYKKYLIDEYNFSADEGRKGQILKELTGSDPYANRNKYDTVVSDDSPYFQGPSTHPRYLSYSTKERNPETGALEDTYEPMAYLPLKGESVNVPDKTNDRGSLTLENKLRERYPFLPPFGDVDVELPEENIVVDSPKKEPSPLTKKFSSPKSLKNKDEKEEEDDSNSPEYSSPEYSF